MVWHALPLQMCFSVLVGRQCICTLQGMLCQMHLGHAKGLLRQSIKCSRLIAVNNYCFRSCYTLQAIIIRWIICFRLHSRRMKEFKVGEWSPWLFHIRHSDAWCSTADYISGPRGLQIGYAYDFTSPVFCCAFKYNWQYLKFINKIEGHPNDTPVQTQRGGGGGQHYAPAALPPRKTRYPHW